MRPLFDPLWLFLGVWTLVLAMLFVAQRSGQIAIGDGISLETIGIIGLSVVAWIVGDCLARLGMSMSIGSSERSKDGWRDEKALNRRTSLLLLIGVLALSLIGYVKFFETWSLIDLVREPLGESFLALNQRVAFEGEIFGGLLGRLYVLPVVGLSLTSYLLARKVLSKKLAFVFFVAFIAMLISPRRALLLQGGLLAILVYEETKKAGKGSYTLPALLFVVTLAFFGFTQIVLAKAEASFSGGVSSILIYITANIPTMQSLLATSHFEEVNVIGNVPLRFINAIFDTNFSVELDVPFVDVGALSNTVPFQYYLHKEGGYLAVVLGSMLLGFGAQAANKLSALRGTFGYVWLKAGFLIFVLFSFREFTLITYNWIFFVIVAIVLGFLMHQMPRVRL